MGVTVTLRNQGIRICDVREGLPFEYEGKLYIRPAGNIYDTDGDLAYGVSVDDGSVLLTKFEKCRVVMNLTVKEE